MAGGADRLTPEASLEGVAVSAGTEDSPAPSAAASLSGLGDRGAAVGCAVKRTCCGRLVAAAVLDLAGDESIRRQLQVPQKGFNRGSDTCGAA